MCVCRICGLLTHYLQQRNKAFPFFHHQLINILIHLLFASFPCIVQKNSPFSIHLEVLLSICILLYSSTTSIQFSFRNCPIMMAVQLSRCRGPGPTLVPSLRQPNAHSSSFNRWLSNNYLIFLSCGRKLR